jgi:CheY-like chemotaxis protein
MDPPNPLRRDVEGIVEACKRGRDLTRNLLGFARKGKYSFEAFSLNAAALDVVALLRRTISKKVVFNTRLEENLAFVQGDPAQISHALMNVCINAADAMPHGGMLTIASENVVLGGSDLAAHPELKPGRYARLSVSDTGAGMSPETLRRCFEPFFTTKPKGQGTGLGLSMVYGTAANHGGMVNVESELGRGTMVTIHLPALESSAVELKPAERKRPVSKPGTGTILIVDDEKFIRSMGKRMLETLGYTVLLAENGKEALEVYRKWQDKISLVVLDLMMPVMDGAEAFRKLREVNPRLRILISSGYTKEEKAESLLAAGAAGFVQKPFDIETFSEELAKALK